MKKQLRITPDNQDSIIIKKLVHHNPRKPGTHGHRSFSVLRSGMTYRQYRAKGGRNNDLHWDLDHGYIAIQVL